MAPKNNKKNRSPRTSQHPFDQPSADLILRTADLVDFRVHSQILAQASPFFASMLALPQPIASATSASEDSSANDTPPGPDATPIVPVSEDSATLELLLRLIYPISKPRAQMDDPQTMVPALLAATKYEMTLPIDIMSERLATIIPRSPLQVWAAACRTGLESVARQAALALKESWKDSGTDALSFVDELGNMTGISAGDYFRLKRFLAADQTRTEEFGALTLLSPSSENARPSVLPPLPAEFSTDIPSTDVTCWPFNIWGSGFEIPLKFSAHQAVLSAHSPVLKARLAELRLNAASTSSTVDAPDTTSSPGLVLNFLEGPEVVSALLDACYDAEKALSTDLDFLARLVVASQKYQMAYVAPRIRAAWDEAAGSRPLAAYFVALACHLEECAEDAAKEVLRGPVKDVYEPVMEDASALVYHLLLAYYDACCAVVEERMGAAIRKIPAHQTVPRSCSKQRARYDKHDLVTDISTSPVTEPLKAMTATARSLSGPTELMKALGDAVINGTERDIQECGQDHWTLVRGALQCVVLTPDEIDRALKEVKLEITGSKGKKAYWGLGGNQA